MVSVLEEVKRVSLIKETPSAYLLKYFDRAHKCIEAIYWIEFNYWEENYCSISNDQRWCATYWIMHHYGFDFDSEEGINIRINAAY